MVLPAARADHVFNGLRTDDFPGSYDTVFCNIYVIAYLVLRGIGDEIPDSQSKTLHLLCVFGGLKSFNQQFL